jgi:hypothetical protein
VQDFAAGGRPAVSRNGGDRIMDFADLSQKIAQAALDGVELTEDGLALAFTKAHQDKLRYDHSIGRWFHWTGKAWRRDETKLGARRLSGDR